MIHIRHWLAYVVIAIISNSYMLQNAAAKLGCSHPELDTLLENSRRQLDFHGSYFPAPEAIYSRFSENSHPLQWAGVSWEGPPEGAVFVLGCNGDRLAVYQAGYVKRLIPGPRLAAVGQTVEVVYVTSIGTGEQENAVALLAFVHGKIRRLWQHVALEASALGEDDHNPESSTVYEWVYAKNGHKIDVFGNSVPKFVEFPYKIRVKRNDAKRSDREVFFWSTKAGRYVQRPGHENHDG